MSNRMDDVLVFLEQPATTTATQMKTTQWAAEIGGHDTFIITRITQQDLINTVAGKVNFFGYEKPKLGTLEEHTDVFLLTWLYGVVACGLELLTPSRQARCMCVVSALCVICHHQRRGGGQLGA